MEKTKEKTKVKKSSTGKTISEKVEKTKKAVTNTASAKKTTKKSAQAVKEDAVKDLKVNATKVKTPSKTLKIEKTNTTKAKKKVITATPTKNALVKNSTKTTKVNPNTVQDKKPEVKEKKVKDTVAIEVSTAEIAKKVVAKGVNESTTKIKAKSKVSTPKTKDNSEQEVQTVNVLKEVNSENQQELNSKKTRVLYVVSECQPFCATGGLADVAGSLPKFIVKNKNVDVRVVLPLYSNIPVKYKSNFKYLGNRFVPLAWRSIYCGVFSYELDGVTYYFLDNEQYFKRDGGIYSYYDDGERFAFMSRAVLEILGLIDFIPNIIHCNDWQTALVPIYLKTVYAGNPYYSNIKTVFTLHNTEYQGKFDLKVIGDLFGIDARYKNLLEYNKDLNLVKGAICCCDKFTTVSPSYSQEILGPEHSNGLDGVLRANTYKICGILNAIDDEFYNPKTDDKIFKNYDVKSLNNKKINKTELQKEFGLEVNADVPMISIVTRMAKHKGLDLIRGGIESVLSQRPVQFIAIGGGDPEYENYFRYLENKYRGRVKAALGYSNDYGRKAYAASDIFLMPSMSEPCGISQMIACKYGSVPIVRETGGLKDTIRDFGCEGGGNGYTFYNYTIHDLVYSINRALDDYNNPKIWEEKVKICMNLDFSWKHSADGYVKIYNELAK